MAASKALKESRERTARRSNSAFSHLQRLVAYTPTAKQAVRHIALLAYYGAMLTNPSGVNGDLVSSVAKAMQEKWEKVSRACWLCVFFF